MQSRQCAVKTDRIVGVEVDCRAQQEVANQRECECSGGEADVSKQHEEPALVFAQLTVHNAAAVLFPAWIPLGHSRPRGLDAMGQRLILFGAVVVTLAFMMIPGVVVGGILWLVFQRYIGAAILIPGAIVNLCIVVIEVIAVTEVLGPAYERMDLLAAERAE